MPQWAVRIPPAEAGALVHEAGMVIVGERHGTNEFPTLVLALATAAARAGRVVVAIELADDARGPTAAFARSEGASSDRRRLLTTTSWQRQDGRASQAMLALVDGLRREIAAGARIEIDVFDAVPVAAGDPGSDRDRIERERLLAGKLLAIGARAPTIALSGNVHAELVARADAPDGFVPAARLVAERARLVSLVGRHAGGRSWCTLPIDGHLVSAPHAVDGADMGEVPFIDVDPPSPVRAGVAYVGPITPSPPAVVRPVN